MVAKVELVDEVVEEVVVVVVAAAVVVVVVVVGTGVVVNSLQVFAVIFDDPVRFWTQFRKSQTVPQLLGCSERIRFFRMAVSTPYPSMISPTALSFSSSLYILC